MAAVLALALAACGGSESGDDGGSGGGNAGVGAAGTEGKGAEAIPRDALFYASVNIDSESDAWKKATALGAKFPGWQQLVGEFNKSLAESKDGTSYNADIKPWLGDELVFAVTKVDPNAPEAQQAEVIGYVGSKDDAKAKAAIEKDTSVQKTAAVSGYDTYKDDDAFIAVGKNAVLISNTETGLKQAISTRDGGGENLTASSTFKDTLSALPKDNLAVAYLDGARLQSLVDVALRQAPDAAQDPAAQAQINQAREQLKAFQSLAFSFTAEDKGMRFRTVVKADEELLKKSGFAPSDAFKPELDEKVPSNAFLYLGFKDLGPSLQRTLDNMAATMPELGQQIGQMEAALGISVKDEVVPLLSGEHAVYAGLAGAPVGGLLLKPADAAKGAETLKKLTGAAAKQSPELQFQPVAGGEGQQVTVSGQTVLWRKVGDLIALSNDVKAGEDQAGGLAGNAKYKDLVKAADMPEEVTAVAYLDIPSLVGLAGLTGAEMEPEVQANAQHVGGLLAWGTKDGGTYTGDLFLEIK